jgi:glycosyltransferase involved in cell wall biosynthesis
MPATHTLALTMIVRNEEAHIGTALQHARRFADQIVIVDTGSTDRTKEICATVADEVLDFEWCDDFAKARNVGLERCTTDFIIWLDADDRVTEETADRIAALMRDPDPAARDWDALMLPYVYARDAAGNPTLVQYRERIFRNHCGLRFEFPIHECLKFVPGTRVRDRDDMPIIHNKVAPAESSRVRNLRILRQAVETDEYRAHPRIWRWMAREEEAEASIPIYRKIFEEFRGAYTPGVLSEMHVGCARKLLSLRRFDEAREELGLAIAAYPAWREPYFYFAQALWFLKRHAEALQVLTLAEGIPPPRWDVIHHNPSIYGGTQFLEWKFFILRSLGRHEEMRATIRQALQLEPGHPRFLKRQRKWRA